MKATYYDTISGECIELDESDFMRRLYWWNFKRINIHTTEKVTLNSWYETIGLPITDASTLLVWRSYLDTNIFDLIRLRPWLSREFPHVRWRIEYVELPTLEKS